MWLRDVVESGGEATRHLSKSFQAFFFFDRDQRPFNFKVPSSIAVVVSMILSI